MLFKGPIIILDSDVDDHELLQTILRELDVNRKVYFFKDGFEALDYLNTTKEQPFIIISEVNLLGLSGLEFRRTINGNEYLRKKSIPFVFFTDNPDERKVEEAYEMMVQGYFFKKHSMEGMKNTIRMLLEYWEECLHRNSIILK